MSIWKRRRRVGITRIVFGMNLVGIVNFGTNLGAWNCLLSIPEARNHKEFPVKEMPAKSGIYAKENHIEICEKIEISPTLRNEEEISVFDTAPTSYIGSTMSGVQEIEDNRDAIHEPTHHDIIRDAEPVENEVIAEESKKQKPVIATDTESKAPETQADFSLKQDEIHELLDGIYNTDIALCHKFKRVGSPARADTKLTRAVTEIVDHAKALREKVNCYTKVVFQVIMFLMHFQRR